jgi:hypothetical protein
MEVGQGPNWGCSAKGEKIITVNNWAKLLPDFYSICSAIIDPLVSFWPYTEVNSLENTGLKTWADSMRN